MQRYFVEKNNDNIFILSNDDSYHITKVMRMDVGEKIEIVCDSKLYICEIVDLKPTVKTRLLEEVLSDSELSCQITIVQSLVKEQKMDYILQKTTELGVSEIIPYEASRSLIKIDHKQDKKIDRWQKIMKEAAEQSKRTNIPKICSSVNLSNLVKLSDYDMKFLCTVNETSQNLKKLLSKDLIDAKILFVIGPEGGFTPEEEKTLMDNDFIPVSLGSSVLRTETASVFIMSVIRYLDMR